MQNESHENPPIIQQNDNQQARQNLLNLSNHQQLQMQNLSLPELLGQSMTRADADQFLRHQLFINIFNQLNSRRTIIPHVPISKYKYFTEMFMFLFCLVEIVFFQITFVHVIWLPWYTVLGFYRHWIINRKTRFFGELININLWIVTHCYIFSHHKDGYFPVIFLVANMDYYFIGYNLIVKYYCFFFFTTWNCFANFRLKMIIKKIEKRRRYLIKERLSKFTQDEKDSKLKQGQLSLSQSQHQSVQSMEKQINQQQQQDDRNSCPICLTYLNPHADFEQKNMQILRLKCQHRYHYGCLKSWVETGHSQCPVCRIDFMK